MLDQIPNLKTRILSEKITVPVDPKLKSAIMQLKVVHKKDHLEWIRIVLRREIAKIKKSN